MSSTEQYDQEIQDRLKAANTVCQYVDWLLSTVNPVPPEQELWIRPDIHPCKKRHKNISKYEQDSDYIDLLTDLLQLNAIPNVVPIIASEKKLMKQN